MDNTKRQAVFPNEKHEFSTGWRVVQNGGPTGCTARRASGLHIKAAWRAAEKGGVRTALFCSLHRLFPQPAGPSLFCAARRPALLSSVQPAESSHFLLGNTAFQLVLSYHNFIIDKMSYQYHVEWNVFCWLDLHLACWPYRSETLAYINASYVLISI